jgi:hypothetical protein
MQWLWLFVWSAWGWVEMGPEKGHILDASVYENRIYVTTRVGVLRASRALNDWERDSRFPPDTKVVGAWKEGVWAAPPGSLWEVTDDNLRLAKSFQQSLVVDIDVSSEGLGVAAVRGKEQGVWIVSPNGEPLHFLEHIDPWVVCVHDQEIWVGSVGEGLWVQETRETPFVQHSTGSVTALDVVQGHVYAAYSNGFVFDVHTQKQIFSIPGGYATSLSSVSGKQIFLTVGSPGLGAAPFQLFDGSSAKSLLSSKVDRDKSHLSPTGSWSLGDGSALVGTFRRGPLVWEGETENNNLQLASENFHATVSGGAAIDRWGKLVLALMGTGVYVWNEGSFAPHLPKGPVTDSVAVKRVGDTVVVLDFDSVRILSASGTWLAMRGVPDRRQGRKNALIDIGRDAEEEWWAIDSYGKLYRWSDKRWKSCLISNVLRIDGYGEDMLLATRNGYREPDCQEDKPVHPDISNVRNSRSAGKWVATPKGLFFDGVQVESLSGKPIQLLIPDGAGVLLAQEDAPILQCTDECRNVAPSFSDDLKAMGRLPDGTLWALEGRGTLWKDDGTGRVPAPWSRSTSHRMSNGSYLSLYKEPWMRNPKLLLKKVDLLREPNTKSWLVLLLLPVLILAGLVWRVRKNKRAS